MKDYEMALEEITYHRYYSDSMAALRHIGNTVVSDKRNVLMASTGRSASTNFEKLIALPAIGSDKDELMRKINAEFSNAGSSTKVVSISVSLDEQDEAQSREWFDFSFDLEINGTRLLIPVNIKYTAGRTKDNVGGWNALQFCLFSKLGKGKGYKGVFESSDFKEGLWRTAPVSDYFLLSFIHGEDNATNGYRLGSLLSLTENERAFNASQSFPVQAKISDEQKIITASMADARDNFIGWILNKKFNHDKAESARSANFLANYAEAQSK